MELHLLPAVQKAYDLNRWLLPRVERFSRRYKFTLGDRLQGTALDLCLALVEATHSRSKERPLYLPIPTNPATESERRRPPVGAQRRTRLRLDESGRLGPSSGGGTPPS